MKIITSREYTGEMESFVPLIGFKVVSVENGSAKSKKLWLFATTY